MGIRGARGKWWAGTTAGLIAAALAAAGSGCAVDRSGYDGTRPPPHSPGFQDPDRDDVLKSRAERKGQTAGFLIRNKKLNAGATPQKAAPTEDECRARWLLDGHEAELGAGNVEHFITACVTARADGLSSVSPPSPGPQG